MAKGYYVIGNDEPIETQTKTQALKIANKLYDDGITDVFIQRFNDEWQDGYFSESKAIFIKEIK